MSIRGDEGSVRTARERGAAEAARFALLGLLLARPAHGYDLARAFVPTAALGDVIRLSASHLYALLGRLEGDGLIAGRQQDAGSRPQRRVYHLTDAGRDAVHWWAAEPVGHPRDMRIDFPLKLYIARMLGADCAQALIRQQRTVFHDYIARLQSAATEAEIDEDGAFIELMRAGRIGRAQAALDWLDLCTAL